MKRHVSDFLYWWVAVLEVGDGKRQTNDRQWKTTTSVMWKRKEKPVSLTMKNSLASLCCVCWKKEGKGTNNCNCFLTVFNSGGGRKELPYWWCKSCGDSGRRNCYYSHYVYYWCLEGRRKRKHAEGRMEKTGRLVCVCSLGKKEGKDWHLSLPMTGQWKKEEEKADLRKPLCVKRKTCDRQTCALVL